MSSPKNVSKASVFLMEVNMFKLVSVDAWLCDGCWNWNNWFQESSALFAPKSLPKNVVEFLAILETCGIKFQSTEGLSIEVDNDENQNICLCETVVNKDLGDDLPPKPLYALIWAGNS
jgi:hypothetical protein